jgi:uncharacterized protein (UPF0210 family)
MRIRTVTSFFDPASADAKGVLNRLTIFREEAVHRFEKECAEVQSTRLATTPFSTWLSLEKPEEAVATATALESAAEAAGFAYLGLGPAIPRLPQSYELLLPLLKATHNVFLGGMVAEAPTSIHLAAVKVCAHVIEAAATVTPDGFTNLRFAALANVMPYAPFFPAAYAEPGRPAFALALEAADVALTAFKKAGSLVEARQSLLDELHRQTSGLERVANELASQFEVDFKGIDCSLAPFPEDWCSIGSALESLGISNLGQGGSLAAAAVLADTLDRGGWQKVGFNGLMLPVLEDSTLAQRSGGTLGLKDLLLFSAVCGTGLDTVPLPGSASAAQIAALLLDMAALSVRLNKPLTARLMPVPGKEAGDRTSFDFSYFSNGRLMSLEPGGLEGLLAGDEVVEIRPRRR